jgi:hypothetical protein
MPLVFIRQLRIYSMDMVAYRCRIFLILKGSDYEDAPTFSALKWGFFILQGTRGLFSFEIDKWR